MYVFFSFWEALIYALAALVMTATFFVLLFFDKLPKLRKPLWVIYSLAILSLVVVWVVTLFPEYFGKNTSDGELSIYCTASLIGWIILIFFSIVFLTSEKDKNIISKKISGLMMIIAGVAVVTFSFESIIFRDTQREQWYNEAIEKLDCQSTDTTSIVADDRLIR